MKTSLLFVCGFALMGILLVSPASASMCDGADNVYCNGAGINGQVDAWSINFGSLVSNSFTVGSGPIGGVDFGVWLLPGDAVTSIDWYLGTSAFGSDVASGAGAAVGLGPVDECGGFSCDFGANQYGYDIQSLEFSFGRGINLAGGTYWITLLNAVSATSNPVYWDENGGSSLAFQSGIGSVPSEAFAIDTVPEPGTLALLGGSGLLFLAGALRRKLLNR
jgi:hypothetical protein